MDCGGPVNGKFSQCLGLNYAETLARSVENYLQRDAMTKRTIASRVSRSMPLGPYVDYGDVGQDGIAEVGPD